MPSAKTQRMVPMRVICPSMSRSGTDSMRRALEILGIGRTMHGFRLGDHPERIDIWLELVNRKFYPGDGPAAAADQPITAADLDRVLGDYAATTDMPCAAFWRELLTAYPDAKVVLTERPADAWRASFKAVVVDGMMSARGAVFANPWIAAYVGDRWIEMMFRCFLGYFGARDKSEVAANAGRVYAEHNAAIRAACREEGRELLDYELGSGWGPLCDFLGVEVPEGVEFPSGNSAGPMIEMTHMIQKQRIAGLVRRVLGHTAVAVTVLGVGWMSFTRPLLLKSWARQLIGASRS